MGKVIIDDFTIATILYEIMIGTPSRVVADKYKVPFPTLQRWEKEHSTLWVLRTLKEGGVKI